MTEQEKQFYEKHNLFPVVQAYSGKKHPAKDWKKTEEHHIYDARKLNGKGYLIVCGQKSNIMVVDVDGKDRPFLENFNNLTSAAGLSEEEIKDVKSTLIIKTPNKGYHLYFKYREGLKNSVSQVSDEIDIRTEGGVIMGPWSEIIALDKSRKKYKPFRGEEIKEMPEKLFQYMLENQGSRKKNSSPSQNKNDSVSAGEDEDDPFISLKGMKEGDGRNDTFFRVLISYCKSKNIRELAVMESIAERVQREYFEKPEPGLMRTVKSVHEKLNGEVAYIYKEKGKDKVNTALLSKYMSENCEYLIVRKNGFDQDFLYWYQAGCYRRISVNEFKGKIKEFIPLEIRKASMYDEVYKQLVTDKTTVRVEDLDKDSRYINFKNGLYNIKTKELESHRADILSTIQINANYNPDASIPEKWVRYLEFLTENNLSLMHILQEWVGLTISNIPGFEPKKSLALYGPNGNNGKSVFINMLDYLIGTENIATRDIQDLSKPFGTSDLYGKKALLIDDQKEADFADSSIFKSITGGGLIACEFKGKQSFSYRFNGTVTFGCNELPYLAGEKGSHIFERLMIIPCYNVLTPEMRDPKLLDYLKEELEGVILWALEGLQRLLDNGLKFTKSEASVIAGEEYRMKSDTLYRFVMEECELTGNSDDRILKSVFENDYEAWAIRNEILSPIQKKNIKDRAQKIGIKFGKISNYYYIGVKYKTCEDASKITSFDQFSKEHTEKFKREEQESLWGNK